MPEDNVRIPLKLKGTVSYFPVWTPALKVIETCQTLTITSEMIEWNPHSMEFSEQENAIAEMTTPSYNIALLKVKYDEYTSTLLCRMELGSECKIPTISRAIIKKKQLFIEKQELAQRWAICQMVGENTIKTAAQLFIRSVLHPIEC